MKQRGRCTAILAGILLLAGLPRVMAGKFNRVRNIGDAAPVWKNLQGVDGRRHSLTDYKNAKLVVLAFLCNRCPTTKQYLSRLREVSRRYRKKGVQFIAISCSLSPADRLEKMKEFALKNRLPFPYLYDPSQRSARLYGVMFTPQFFVLDGKRRIAYMGAWDDNAEPARVEEHYLVDALNALLAGRMPEFRETRPFGCELEYRGK